MQKLLMSPAAFSGAGKCLRSAAVAVALLLPAAAFAQSAQPQRSAAAMESWHTALKKTPVPHKGCYTAAFPSTEWHAVPCAVPPARPYQSIHRLGITPLPGIVGNGNDMSAQAASGLISSATGSFDQVTNAVSEADGGTANRFSLQLNTDFFTSPTCAGASVPGSCRGWEQFVYSNSGVAFIQYWLIGWNTTCPTGWNSFGGDCWKNAPSGASYTVQPIANLAGLKLTGTANANGTDTVIIAGPNGTASAANVDSVLTLAKAWQAAEFNVIGDCCGSQANFNSGVTIIDRTTVNSGTSSAPACVHEGFTGETNDLNLAGTCSRIGGVSPAVVFTESNPPGSIWDFTGTACTGTSCPGWKMLDDNNLGVRIAATGSALYELWNTGNIWQYTGTACTGSSCPGWKMLDNNPAGLAIVAGGNELYQLHNTGKIWRYTGTPCSGTSCPGWQMLDNNPAAVTIAASSGGLYQLHNTGKIWRYTGTPCSGSSCPGWQLLDNNPLAVAITTGSTDLYQLHNDGTVWQYTGTPCGSGCPGWKLLNNNPNALSIVADSAKLYELDNNGTIWQYTGTPCSGSSCPGWQKLDDNPAATNIASDGVNLYQLHNNGSVWKFTGTACTGSSCPGWQMIDDNAWTGRIAATNGHLYQLHVVSEPLERALICYDCR
jgi:hypothetical protein